MITAVFLGVLVAVAVKTYARSKNVGGWVITLLLGVTGSFFSYFIGAKAGIFLPYEPLAIIVSLLGASFVLALYSYLLRKTTQLN
ncbi:GlsB/YeaQ/YmgE family stress response membrane protein [Bdellovibrio sp. NC01]|uniref:GlsB/YeaQ/YmgE family stress response membrane protein n=1 Tax=Bdellovibrio sp. NC01 TaxID=2220073 RepID=UPI001159D29F|nr:GlsB/YeaQ/YmgE family stress response membrane protein [Bdellovibrio sp. NC01]QDK36298.1 GlsB/YeaQ/YmgE family stress response membrane protein [Bdellovibrio sp. NC01]